MKIANGKLNFLLVLLCIFLVIGFNHCDAGKDKDKHKQKPKHEPTTRKNATQHHHHQNATAHHHQNHTTPHHSAGDTPSHDSNPPPIGWSLHNNQNQPPPAANPHGYAVQHHNPAHPDQSHQSPQQPHSPQAQHHSQQAQPQPVPNQDSGPSALGAGIGGLALGALGGAAGGYLLSNALNSNDKSEEKASESATELITETTLSTLPSSVQDLNATTVEGSTAAASSIIADELSQTVVAETTPQILIGTSENVPTETLTSSSIQPPLEVIKSEQKLAENELTTSETSKDKSNGAVNNLSLIVLVISITSNSLLFARF